MFERKLYNFEQFEDLWEWIGVRGVRVRVQER